jgi:dihydrodipicolinate synthase/N-acetylneuraminate lyase
MTKLHGVIVPVATPLLADESLDGAGLARLVERLIRARVHGLFANGSMGGFAFHPDAMQDEVIATICEAAGLPVQAVVVLAPYYFIYSQPELAAFFRAIAEESPLPIVLYENPRLVPCNSIHPAMVAELARHPNIIGLKNSSADDAQWKELFEQDLPRERFALICGAEKRMGDGLRAGYDGLTGGFHNVAPEVAVALYEQARAGNWACMDQLQAKLNRAYRIFEIAGGWRGLEVSLQQMGIASKATVRPFDDRISAATQLEINGILESVR